MVSNFIRKQLEDLDIIDPGNLQEFFPRVRDNENISVMKCNSSNVLFLSESEHIQESYYNKKTGLEYWGGNDREKALKETYTDDHRRYLQFKELVKGKKYIDIGTGLGGMLDLFKKDALSVAGVELQDETRDLLSQLGFEMYSSIAAIPESKAFEVISLFHVFEHLHDPLNDLKLLKERLSPGGKIIIEVPHANDALITLYDLNKFKEFTFWSEHLILHTKESIKKYLEHAGFSNISVEGYQRYPLANHMWWLLHGEPGGQFKLDKLRNEELEKAYDNLLRSLDLTDTLIATAEKK